MRVLVRERIADAGVELLQARFDVDIDLDSPLEEIIDRYDALIVRSATKVTAELPREEDVSRVRSRLAGGGWPLADPSTIR